MPDVSDLDTLSNLLKFREISLYNELEKSQVDLKKAGKSPY